MARKVSITMNGKENTNIHLRDAKLTDDLIMKVEATERRLE
jgi:hypothetical protein